MQVSMHLMHFWAPHRFPVHAGGGAGRAGAHRSAGTGTAGGRELGFGRWRGCTGCWAPLSEVEPPPPAEAPEDGFS